MKAFKKEEKECGGFFDEWSVRPYSKSELADAYSPEITHGAAVNRFGRWIRRNEALHAELLKTGYIERQQIFTSRQVALVFEYLGKP